jgi:hypothetical protein
MLGRLRCSQLSEILVVSSKIPYRMVQVIRLNLSFVHFFSLSGDASFAKRCIGNEGFRLLMILP